MKLLFIDFEIGIIILILVTSEPVSFKYSKGSDDFMIINQIELITGIICFHNLKLLIAKKCLICHPAYELHCTDDLIQMFSFSLKTKRNI